MRAGIIAVVLLLAAVGCAESPEPGGGGGRPIADVGSRGDCDENYSGCVPNVDFDLDCPDVDGPISVYGADPHGFDRDGDGIACEPYNP